MIKSPWPKNWIIKFLVFVWSIPLGIVGLLLSLFLILLDKPLLVEANNGALEIVFAGRISDFFSTRKWAAFTIGWSIFYWGIDRYTVNGRIHERVHIKQYWTYGILFIFIYLYWNFTRGYKDNPFEIEARAAELEISSSI